MMCWVKEVWGNQLNAETQLECSRVVEKQHLKQEQYQSDKAVGAEPPT